MHKSILKALLGSPPSRPPSRQYRERREHNDFDGEDDDDNISSFNVGGGAHDRAKRDWWAFSFPPNRPEGGPWQIMLGGVEVAGTQHRRDDVSGFVYEVETTKRQGRLKEFPFSVYLEAEPANPYDHNAIRVLGRTGQRSHSRLLGYLPRDLAAELAGRELLPIEVVRYFEREDYSELKINILQRKPTREEKIAQGAEKLKDVDIGTIEVNRRKPPIHYLELAKSLKRAGRVDEAASVLEQLVDVPSKNVGPPPAAWWDLAVIYRERKDYAAEVALLERCVSRDRWGDKSLERFRLRLEKARTLEANAAEKR